jgi:DNA polymerase/3'-5' exonuclease PolX
MKTALITEHLRELSKLYGRVDETHRCSSFHNAAHNIDESGIEEVESSKDYAGIRGVGPSTCSVIDEFIKTGSSTRFKELNERLTDVETSEQKLSAALDVLKKFKKP